MRVPPFFKDLPNEAVKRVVDLLNQPQLVQTVKDAAQQIGVSTEWGASQVQDSMKQAKRWLDSVNARWRASAAPCSTPVINATGLVFTSELSLPPTDASTNAAYAGAFTGSIDDAAVRESLETQLAQMAGAESALVVHNVATAIQYIAMHPSLVHGIVLPRKHEIRLPDGGDVMSLVSRHNKVHEIGAVNSLTIHDFAATQLGTDTVKQTAVLQIYPTESFNNIAAELSDVDAQDAILARSLEYEQSTVEVRYDAALCDLHSVFPEACHIGSRIAKGVTAILFPGDMLIGAVRCGVIVGTSRFIDPIRELARVMGGTSSTLTNIMLLGALESNSSAEAWKQTLVGEMLTGSIENEMHRAKRIAAQLQGSTHIESASVSEQPVALGTSVWSHVKTPTAVIDVVAKNGIDALSQQLSKFKRRIVPRNVRGQIQIAMRTVDPADDREIVSAFCD